MEPAGQSDNPATSSGSTEKSPTAQQEERQQQQQQEQQPVEKPLVEQLAKEAQSTSNAAATNPATTTNNTTTNNTKTTSTNHSANSSAATTQETAFIESLIEDVIFCECLQVHRAAKMGFIFTDPGDETYRIKEGNGLDVFGQPLSSNHKSKKTLLCNCPECGRNIGTVRFAHHLEKCMGMGRLSSRVAAATNKRDATG